MKGLKAPVMNTMVNTVDNNHSSSVLSGQMVCRTDWHSWGQEKRRRKSNCMWEKPNIKQGGEGKCEPPTKVMLWKHQGESSSKF